MQQSAIVISPVNMESRKALGIRPGDTVRVWQKIEEKGKTRLQAFEGLVLARKHGSEAGATFTVRRVTGGVGVEKIYPLYSPMIDKIEIVRRSKVRRAKLYHIREKVAREIKRQMRKMNIVSLSSASDMEDEAEALKAAEQAQAEAVATPEETVVAEASSPVRDEVSPEVSVEGGEEAEKKE
jgi:large subunit ribosomal protein L19